jgi:hypothetical protein
MPAKDLSIDCFFSPVCSTSSAAPLSSNAAREGDGFTTEEINAVLNPVINSSWAPENFYEETDIGSLDAGPYRVHVRGRIVNLFDQVATIRKPKAAKGCFKMIVKDDTGAFVVGYN